MRLGRHVHELGVAAPVGRRQALLGQLAANAVGVRALLVDLVDRDHDRHLGRLGVVDRLHGLRHHAVVGRHHDHRDVGDLGAAGAHGGERLVARGVEEGDRVVVVVHLVGADVLGDAAGLAGRHLGLADGVEQRGLAVVDVAHDGDHRRAVDQVVVGVVVLGLRPRPRRRRAMISTFLSKPSASTSIASSESVWVSVAISPSSISFLITSGAREPERLRHLLDGRAGLTGPWAPPGRVARGGRAGRAPPTAGAGAGRGRGGRLLRGRRLPVAAGGLRVDHHAAAAPPPPPPPASPPRAPRVGRARPRRRRVARLRGAVAVAAGCAALGVLPAGRGAVPGRRGGLRLGRGRRGGLGGRAGAVGEGARDVVPRRRWRQPPSRRGRPLEHGEDLLAGDPLLLRYLVNALLCHRRTKSMVSCSTVTGARNDRASGPAPWPPGRRTRARGHTYAPRPAARPVRIGAHAAVAAHARAAAARRLRQRAPAADAACGAALRLAPPPRPRRAPRASGLGHRRRMPFSGGASAAPPRQRPAPRSAASSTTGLLGGGLFAGGSPSGGSPAARRGRPPGR